MRMWMIPSECLCRRHLLGEHNEIHKHRHIFEKKYSIKGRINPVVQISPYKMEDRHNELVEEMLKRGYNHKSDYRLPNLEYLREEERYAKVDIVKSIDDLYERCNECKLLIEQYANNLWRKSINNLFSFI